jgi:NAD-dependent deacetylase
MIVQEERMDNFVKLLTEAHHCVVFTGAGVSTLSGIRDFRGKNGFYSQTEDADKIFDLYYFLQDPSLYYRRSKNFIYDLEEKEPGIVHTEIARLEAAGLIKAVITQNIDLLHQKAGTRNVIEVHGSPRLHRCLDCGSTYDFEEIAAIVRRDELPVCQDCGGSGRIFPPLFPAERRQACHRQQHDHAPRPSRSSALPGPRGDLLIYPKSSGGLNRWKSS